MTQYDDEIPDDLIESADEGPVAPRRRVRLTIQPEDDEPIRRYRWWHIAGALFLVFVMLAEVIVPVIQGVIEMVRFVPSGLGSPL